MKKRQLNSTDYLSVYGMYIFMDRARFAIYRLRELELAAFGLTVEQNRILNLLVNGGGSATPKILEELTMRQHHSISTLINRMIKVKYIARQKIPAGKGFLFTITREGREAHKNSPLDSLVKVFSVFSQEEREQLVNLLDLVFVKARELLGLTYVPPFRQLFTIDKVKAAPPRITEVSYLTEYGIWTKLNHTNFVVYRLRELELAQFDLTPEQYALLNLLVHEGGSATARKIEDLTMRQHHSISTLINRMIKTGSIEKHKKLVGRGYEIAITRSGRELHKKVPSVSFEMVFSSLSLDERQQLARFLILLLVKARELLGQTNPFTQYDSQF